MLHASQLRAARALLAWKQDELAKAAGIGLATIQRLERGEGPVQGHVRTAIALQETLEAAGVRFIDQEEVGGVGVRLNARARRR